MSFISCLRSGSGSGTGFGSNYLLLSSLHNYIKRNNGLNLYPFVYTFAPILPYPSPTLPFSSENFMHFMRLLYEIVWHYMSQRIFWLNISNIFGITLGPDFWGRLNPKWSLCSRGRRQSPIDINPQLLLFDPNLKPLTIHGDYVSICLSRSSISSITH